MFLKREPGFATRLEETDKVRKLSAHMSSPQEITSDTQTHEPKARKLTGSGFSLAGHKSHPDTESHSTKQEPDKVWVLTCRDNSTGTEIQMFEEERGQNCESTWLLTTKVANCTTETSNNGSHSPIESRNDPFHTKTKSPYPNGVRRKDLLREW